MNEIYASIGKNLTFMGETKRVKDVRCKYGINLQVVFEDDTMFTVTENNLPYITIH